MGRKRRGNTAGTFKPGDKVAAPDVPGLEGAVLEVVQVDHVDGVEHVQVHAPDQGHGCTWVPASALQPAPSDGKPDDADAAGDDDEDDDDDTAGDGEGDGAGSSGGE